MWGSEVPACGLQGRLASVECESSTVLVNWNGCGRSPKLPLQIEGNQTENKTDEADQCSYDKANTHNGGPPWNGIADDVLGHENVAPKNTTPAITAKNNRSIQ